MASSTPYTDPYFPTYDALVWSDYTGGDLKSDLDFLYIKIKWRRARDIYPDKTLFGTQILPEDVVQGDLGDCYYAAAIAALAEHPELIKQAFVTQNYLANGTVVMQVYVRGVPTTVVIDDYIPTYQGLPAFVSPNWNSGLWPLFLEKVWAKVNGNYENIIGGEGPEGIRFLVGAPTFNFNWGDPGEGELSGEYLWGKI